MVAPDGLECRGALRASRAIFSGVVSRLCIRSLHAVTVTVLFHARLNIHYLGWLVGCSLLVGLLVDPSVQWTAVSLVGYWLGLLLVG